MGLKEQADNIAHKLQWKLWFVTRPIMDIPGIHDAVDERIKYYEYLLNRGGGLETPKVREYRKDVKKEIGWHSDVAKGEMIGSGALFAISKLSKTRVISALCLAGSALLAIDALANAFAVGKATTTLAAFPKTTFTRRSFFSAKDFRRK